MRDIWSVELLDRCSGLNVNFFRAPSIAEWRKVDRDVRRRLEDFSLSSSLQLIEAMQPQRMVMIGKVTARAFGDAFTVDDGQSVS
jgi:hypothetical protein